MQNILNFFYIIIGLWCIIDIIRVVIKDKRPKESEEERKLDIQLYYQSQGRINRPKVDTNRPSMVRQLGNSLYPWEEEFIDEWNYKERVSDVMSDEDITDAEYISNNNQKLLK